MSSTAAGASKKVPLSSTRFTSEKVSFSRIKFVDREGRSQLILQPEEMALNGPFSKGSSSRSLSSSGPASSLKGSTWNGTSSNSSSSKGLASNAPSSKRPSSNGSTSILQSILQSKRPASNGPASISPPSNGPVAFESEYKRALKRDREDDRLQKRSKSTESDVQCDVEREFFFRSFCLSSTSLQRASSTSC